MRPIVRTVTGVTGVSNPLFPNLYVYPNMAVGVTSNNNQSTVTVEHTYDDLLKINPGTGLPFVTPATAKWISNTGLSAVVLNAGNNFAVDSNYQYAPNAIRLNTTSGIAGTVVTLTVIQSGGGTGGG